MRTASTGSIPRRDHAPQRLVDVAVAHELDRQDAVGGQQHPAGVEAALDHGAREHLGVGAQAGVAQHRPEPDLDAALELVAVDRLVVGGDAERGHHRQRAGRGAGRVAVDPHAGVGRARQEAADALVAGDRVAPGHDLAGRDDLVVREQAREPLEREAHGVGGRVAVVEARAQAPQRLRGQIAQRGEAASVSASSRKVWSITVSPTIAVTPWRAISTRNACGRQSMSTWVCGVDQPGDHERAAEVLAGQRVPGRPRRGPRAPRRSRSTPAPRAR